MARSTTQEKIASGIGRALNGRSGWVRNQNGTIDVYVPSLSRVFVVLEDGAVLNRPAAKRVEANNG